LLVVSSSFVRFELMLRRLKMGGRPRKTLSELVRDGSFLARRHAELLAGDPVDDPTLAALQALYRQAGDDRQRRRVALQFEKICRAAPPAVGDVPDVAPDVEPAEELDNPPEAAEPELSYREIIERVWGRQQPFRERGYDPAEPSPHDWWPGKLTGSQPNTWPPIGPPSTDDG
jgi:hypothetical protein